MVQFPLHQDELFLENEHLVHAKIELLKDSNLESFIHSNKKKLYLVSEGSMRKFLRNTKWLFLRLGSGQLRIHLHSPFQVLQYNPTHRQEVGQGCRSLPQEDHLVKLEPLQNQLFLEAH